VDLNKASDIAAQVRFSESLAARIGARFGHT
jgi:hypothetical protein